MKLFFSLVAGFVLVAGIINFHLSMDDRSIFPIWVSHPLMIIAIAYLLFQNLYPALIYRTNATERAQVVQSVTASGGMLAETSCGGAIGLLQLGGPLLRVRIYPAGIIIKPPFMPPAAILNHEITSVRVQKQWIGEVLEITHRAAAFVSPIQLSCGASNPVRALLLNR